MHTAQAVSGEVGDGVIGRTPSAERGPWSARSSSPGPGRNGKTAVPPAPGIVNGRMGLGAAGSPFSPSSPGEEGSRHKFFCPVIL